MTPTDILPTFIMWIIYEDFRTQYRLTMEIMSVKSSQRFLLLLKILKYRLRAFACLASEMSRLSVKMLVNDGFQNNIIVVSWRN